MSTQDYSEKERFAEALADLVKIRERLQIMALERERRSTDTPDAPKEETK